MTKEILSQPDFSDWLEEKFINSNEVNGLIITKDNVESMFEMFLENQDQEEMIEWANLYGQQMYLIGGKDVINQLKTK
jgi:hypothetical protein